MPTVVIADDDPKLRLLVGTTLTAAWDRCTLLEAANGEAAWELIREHQPVLALLDVGMPVLDGLQLTRAIKGDPELAKTEVVLLTARAQEADLEAGRQAGADVYLTKPFSPLRLLSLIERVLESA